jgi:hypothetical protein
MKRLLATTLLCVAAIAPAQAAKFSWIGSVQITSTSGSCPDYDPTGETGIAHFMPELAGTDNPSGSRITWVQGVWAQHYELGSGLFDTTAKQVTATYMGRLLYDDTSAPVTVKFIKQVPATVSTLTKGIFIVGQIKTFDGMPLCVVNFEMGLSPRH